MPAPDERKPVTVLFADLAGSTELATRHDPEHLRALLSAFFDEMRQQIEAFEQARDIFVEIGATGWTVEADLALQGR